jgi:ribosomal protein L34
MQGTKIARQLAAAKRDRTSSFRERFKLSHGRYVLCESRSQWDWWEEFTTALSKKQIRPDEFSIADLFESLVQDGRELRRMFDPRYGDGNIMAEAAGAVTSSDFSTITGQIVYSMMMQDLRPEDFPFQAVIPTQSTQFSGEKIPGIANLGDLAEIVPENEDYPLMGTSEDYIETPETKKRGFIVPVTKEAIFFDRTGELLQKCSRVGDSLMLNKEKRAIDCIIDQNTTAHRYKWRGTTYATYQTATPWINVTGAANVLVDWSDIDTVLQVYNGLVDPNTGEPVMVEPTTLIVTKENEQTARRIMNATSITVHTGGYAVTGNLVETSAPNPYPQSYRILTSNLLATRATDDQHWWLGAPERYARYMENWPITVTQAPSGNSDDFNRDIVAKFKCSERGQYAVIEPRVMVESID